MLITGVTDNAQRREIHLSSESIVVAYALQFPFAAYKYTSAADAYERVTASLSAAVASGGFTRVLSIVTFYSTLYTHASSVMITADAEPVVMTQSPSTSSQKLNAVVSSGGSDAGDLTVVWIGLAVGVFGVTTCSLVLCCLRGRLHADRTKTADTRDVVEI